jgi:hypothetical protein
MIFSQTKIFIGKKIPGDGFVADRFRHCLQNYLGNHQEEKKQHAF